MSELKDKTCLLDADIVIEKMWLDVHGYWITGSDLKIHRLVAAKALGRELKSTEHVHHVDYNKANNRRSNLVVCSNSLHQLLHQRTDCLNAGFNPNTHLLCSVCKTYHEKEAFALNPAVSRGRSNICREEFNKWRKERGHNKSKWNEKQKLQQQIRRTLKKNSLEKLVS